MVTGARPRDFADASFDTGSIAFGLDGDMSLNDSVRITKRDVSAWTVHPT
jgi:hypothetical protein